MKTKDSVVTIYVLLITIILTCNVVVNAAPVDVVVTDMKGAKIPVKDFRVQLNDQCKDRLFYYANVPRETTTESTSLYLSVKDHQYWVVVPLNIIKTVTLEQNPRNVLKKDWIVTLSDDTILTGSPTYFRTFIGNAELGRFSIEWNAIAQLTFSSPLKESPTASRLSNRSATLYVTDDNKFKLIGVAFIGTVENENGCFIRFTNLDSFAFKTEEAGTYDLTWSAIREIRFEGSGYLKNLRVIAPSGTEYVGKGTGLGIQGGSRFGMFDLTVIVPFASESKRVTTEDK